MEQNQAFVGIHLSGASNNKTSVLVIRRDSPQSVPLLDKIYEKIGSKGIIFSDERILKILSITPGLQEVFVDCPLTHPPCVACTREYCPGVWSCDDLSVAFMLKLSEEIKSQTHLRRKRPVNPQTQRLWDILRFVKNDGGEHGEATYNTNVAPLVNRARTLEKQFKKYFPEITLKETSVSQTLYEMRHLFSSHNMVWIKYKNFEIGKKLRKQFLNVLVEKKLVQIPAEFFKDDLILSVENFSAFVGAWVGYCNSVGMVANPEKNYVFEQGWVHLPDIRSQGL